MKRVITSASTQLPKSKYFELVEETGRGINGQPWRQYTVVSSGAAKEQIVRIELDYHMNWYRGEDEEELEKEVAPSRYDGCYVNWGMKGRINTDEDVRDMIDVLEDALEFETQLKSFLNFK